MECPQKEKLRRHYTCESVKAFPLRSRLFSSTNFHFLVFPRHHHKWFISPFYSNNKNILRQTKRSIWWMNLSKCFFPLPKSRSPWIDVFFPSQYYSDTNSNSFPSTSSWASKLDMWPRSTARREFSCFWCSYIFHASHTPSSYLCSFYFALSFASCTHCMCKHPNEKSLFVNEKIYSGRIFFNCEWRRWTNIDVEK